MSQCVSKERNPESNLRKKLATHAENVGFPMVLKVFLCSSFCKVAFGFAEPTMLCADVGQANFGMMYNR
jgi:hypothetical protein